MCKIEYVYPATGLNPKNHPVKVKLDGKIIGQIKNVDDGWQYVPKGHKKGGEVYKSFMKVQLSLETDDE